MNQVDRIWAERLVAKGRLGPGQAFLDAGGGDGSLCAAIESISGAEGTVLDPAAVDSGASSRTVRGRAEAMPFADARFDLVLVSHTAHLFRKPVVAMKEASRVLKPGGILLMRVSSQDDLRRLPLAEWNPDLFDDLLCDVPPLERISLWMKRAGLARADSEAVTTPFAGTYEQWVAGLVHIATRAWLHLGCPGRPPAVPFEAFVRDRYPAALDFRETLLISRRVCPAVP